MIGYKILCSKKGSKLTLNTILLATLEIPDDSLIKEYHMSDLNYNVAQKVIPIKIETIDGKIRKKGWSPFSTTPLCYEINKLLDDTENYNHSKDGGIGYHLNKDIIISQIEEHLHKKVDW